MTLQTLTMRAEITRPVSGDDDYNGPSHEREHVADGVHCRIYTKGSRLVTDGKYLVVQDVMGIFAYDAGVKDGDIIVSVKDRRGRDVVGSKMAVETVALRNSLRGRAFLVATLKRIK